MNYYNEIKEQIINNEITKKVKDYSKNRSDLQTYYNVGKLLFEAGKHYGEGIIKEYSKKLTNDLNKNYSVRSLYNIRLYYEKICCNEKLQPLAAILSWSHYCELLRIIDENEITYYINISHKQNLSKRELINKIKNKEYQRLDEITKQKLINKEETKIQDLIPNPIMIKNTYNNDDISEKLLKQLILEDLDSFLKELGEDFCYKGNVFKIKLGDRYNYIDLLLYNIKYNCYVVIELKVTELKKEHIGQIQTYMNHVDKNIKNINQESTIGIIICKKDNQFIMEYCSDMRIFTRTFVLS